mmetsp:Transcript_37681/g.52183  ORF Transcript_37681/g.52183 Transcript_37681/m.52183 type:complete len:129 (-) Transcript_37681:25-411(-)
MSSVTKDEEVEELEDRLRNCEKVCLSLKGAITDLESTLSSLKGIENQFHEQNEKELEISEKGKEVEVVKKEKEEEKEKGKEAKKEKREKEKGKEIGKRKEEKKEKDAKVKNNSVLQHNFDEDISYVWS